MNNALAGKLVVVTGCGYTKFQTVFKNRIDGLPSHDEIVVGGEIYKMNMGASATMAFAENGAYVHMVARSKEKLTALQDNMFKKVGTLPECAAVDLMDGTMVKEWVSMLRRDLPIYWFHSAGMSAGSYKTEIGNRWLPFRELTPEHFSTEVLPLWTTTMNVAKNLWPIFLTQQETRIVLISSMSTIRSYTSGASHCAATAALDRLANVLTLEGYKSSIYVTTLRAGGIDTGTYENKEVQRSIINIADEYGCDWRSKGLALASPRAIGELAVAAFSVNAHVTSMNIVSKGQFPHEGS
ncbi:MAG: SDR family oxidoreductase [bacterium]|nr:SDR family oxidoreductase [bacterium]